MREQNGEADSKDFQNKDGITPEKKHISDKNIVWEGDVPPGYFVESTGGTVTIKGNVKGAIVKSKFHLTIEGDAEEKSILSAVNGIIKLRHAENEVSIDSLGFSVILNSVGNSVVIKANDYIKVEENIGTDCKITANKWVSAKTIGARTIVNSNFDVTADIISEDTQITAARGKVTVKRVGERAKIRAKYDVIITEFAAESADIETDRRYGNVIKPKKQPAAVAQGQLSLPPVNISFQLKDGVSVDSVEIVSEPEATGTRLLSQESKRDQTLSFGDATDSKIRLSEKPDLRFKHKSYPLSSQTIPYQTTPEGKTKQVTINLYERQGKTGKISSIKVSATTADDSQAILAQVTWGKVTKTLLLDDVTPGLKIINFYEEQFDESTRVPETRLQPAEIKKELVASSTTTSPQLQSLWASPTSPVVFPPVELKRELPTVTELNKILGTNVVIEVKKGLPIIHTAVSIRFKPTVDPKIYESTLKKKLLAGLTGVSLEVCSIFTEVRIPDDPQLYHQFMQNFETALREANQLESGLGMG